jgi:hypothetical protein
VRTNESLELSLTDVTADEVQTLVPAIPSSDSVVRRSRTSRHFRRRSTVCTRYPATRLPEGNRDTASHGNRHQSFLPERPSRMCESHGVSPSTYRAELATSVRAPKSHRAAGFSAPSSTTGSRRRFRRSGANRLGGGASRMARYVSAPNFRRWCISRSVPYRLDTPPPLAVAHQRRRLVSGSAFQRFRFVAEIARLRRLRSGPPPRRRRRGVDPHRPCQAGDPSTSKRSKNHARLHIV